MKKLFFIAAPLLLLFIFSINTTSCGGNKTDNDSTKTNKADDEFNYDKSAIDKTAPVNEISLTISGESMSDMAYSQKEIKVKSGSTIHLSLENLCKGEAMTHNFVLVRKGTGDDIATAGIEAGASNNYVPASKNILVSTIMLKPSGKTEISFPAPPVGEYDYSCTFPGHWKMMLGKFIVE